MVALSAFVVTNALTGAAPTARVLVAARHFCRAVAGGLVLPQSSAMIRDLRGAERGRPSGILGAVIGLSTAAGPVVAGLILTTSTGTEG